MATCITKTEKIVLGNGLVRAVFQLGSGTISEKYFTIEGKKPRLITESASGSNFSAILLAAERDNGNRTNIVPDYRNEPPKALTVPEPLLSVGESAPVRCLRLDTYNLKEEDEISEVTFHAKSSEGDEVTRVISLKRDEAYFKITNHIRFAQPTSLEFFVDRYYFSPGPCPDFTWTPSIKRDPTCISADWTFKSPSVIIQKDNLSLSVVPDIKSLEKNETLKKCNVGLDLDVTTEPKPVVTYGFIPIMPRYHSAFIHPRGLRAVFPQTTISFSYFLVLSGDAEKRMVYHRVTSFLWQNFGHDNLLKGHAAQEKPFNAWEKEAWHNMGDKVWSEFDYDGEKCGTFRCRPAEIKDDAWFCAWFNNLSTAYGLELYSRRSGDRQSSGRAHRILNLALKAPRNGGAFPIFYNRKDGVHHWDPDHEMGGYRPFYHTFDMSWTSYWLLRWQESLASDDKRILPLCRAYGDFLVGNQHKSGFIPSYYDKDLNVKLKVPVYYGKELKLEVEAAKEKKDSPWHVEHRENLIKSTGREIRLNKESAEPAACATFLAELYKVTGKRKYLNSAIKAMHYIENHIMPENKWFDFETFLSCSLKSYNFYDPVTKQHPQNNMATIQAAKAFLSLYDITKEERFLNLGTEVLDYLSLTQQVWSHPLLTPNLIGGFTTQNSDAEWSDARQAYCAILYLDYFERTNQLEYLERGIAALRSSFAVSPYENWAHVGYLDQPGAVTGFHWGLGSGMASVEMVWERYGDILVDVVGEWAYGINGCTVESFSLKDNQIRLNIISELVWDVPLQIVFRNVPLGKYGLVINEKYIGEFESNVLKTGVRWFPTFAQKFGNQ